MNSPTAEKLERRPTRRSLPEWRNGALWPSWMVSMLLHATVFLLLVWLWRPYSNGSQGERDRPIGIAVVHHSQSGTEYFLEAGGKGDNASDQLSAAALAKTLAAISTNKTTGAMSTEELLGEFSGIGKTTLGSDVTGTGTGSKGLTGLGSSGVGAGRDKVGSTKTNVFGIEGYGNSFVYVFDRSESMNGFAGAPLRMAKRELASSLQSLTSVNQFQIIFYNDEPAPYRGSLSRTRGLIFATDTEKQSASTFVKGITGLGGTEHLPALRKGIDLGSDVIFFLTDAAGEDFKHSDVIDMTERCLSRRTTIHSIEFGTGLSSGAGRWIEQLASRTGGKYRYVDVTNIDQ